MDNIRQIRVLGTTIMNMELEDPKATKLGKMSDAMATALAEAKAADDVYGPNSEEARIAWDEAERVSRLGPTTLTTMASPGHHASSTHRYMETALTSHHYYATVVDPQTLSQTIDAIGKLEHLERLVRMERNRIAGGLHP